VTRGTRGNARPICPASRSNRAPSPAPAPASRTSRRSSWSALIEAGTHDRRATDIGLANDASHAVIAAVPEFADELPDGVRPALVVILDDHIADFEYVAVQYAEPGIIDAPPDAMTDLTYEQGQDFLEVLVDHDDTRGDATRIVGERVGWDIHMSAAVGDTSYANAAGSLSEMGVLATAEADLGDAERQDARKAKVERLVETGALPPVAVRVLNADGTLNVNFIDGPNGDEDIVRSSADGASGEKLAWDLDQDGRISADEREITERELYDATLG
jgi:hypothetical protein